MSQQEQWKEDTLAGLGKGSRVWHRPDPKSWQLATLQSIDGCTCTVALDTSLGEGTGKTITTAVEDVLPANPPLLEHVPDLTTLSFLNEPSILHTLRQRYNDDAIYTHAGPVLIAVNPFKTVQLYTPEHVQRYVSRPATGTRASTTAYEPHIFLTADKAYKQMVANNTSQSILITGESGAGKTETTKFVMQYLAGLAGGTGMEDRVLETNPILEAFGNAKTIHNRNSSRFGKLIEIYFNNRRAICGALIQTYLLEKSRVVHQLPNERSYHIFYQLCRGATDEERAACLFPEGVSPLRHFSYLSSSGCTEIDGVDDAQEFLDTKNAMTAVGISPEMQSGIWKVLSAVLWLGNIRFSPVGDTNSDAVEISSASSTDLANAAHLLGIPTHHLATALTTRKMVVAGTENITRELSMEAAIENRDAFAKAVYEAQFRWLVNQINAALALGTDTAATTSLCILDIYGFECFQQNSFEQLCINYANERLQQQFAAHLFKLEQEVYEEEGVDWTHVQFTDNQECVDMIEARPPAGVGLLSLLDEECMFPKGTDSSWAAKLRQRLCDHPHFSFNPKIPGDAFTLHHYAGPVAYSADRFLDKNRDALSPDLIQVLAASSFPLVVSLAGEMTKGQERSRSQTVGARFRDQLKDLMIRLNETQLHFVRCIKPNGEQKASLFDSPLALHQLRCCGVLEVARIARAGYPTRYLHEEFAERYRLLLPGDGRSGAGALEECTRLLGHFGVKESFYQFGRTKVFFRAGVLGQLEDHAARVSRSVLTIQSTWRMLGCRREYLTTRAAVIALQSAWRGKEARRYVGELRRRHAAATVIQAAVRAKRARADYERARAAVVAIQMGWKKSRFERRASVRDAEIRKEREAREVEEARVAEERAAVEAAARAEQESFEAIKKEFGMDGAQIREVLRLWRDRGNDIEKYLAGGAVGVAVGAGAAAAAVGASAAGGADAVVEAKIAEMGAYISQLEAESNELREENLALMEARAAALAAEAEANKTPGVITVVAAAGPPHIDEMPGSARSLRSDDTVSIMSYSDEEGGDRGGTPLSAKHPNTTNGAGANAPTTRNRRTTSNGSSLPAGLNSPSMSFGRAGPTGAVAALGAEMDKKASLFDDDLAFIQEVHDGVSAAPNMDPYVEIDRLLYRYRSWHKDFKIRMKATQTTLKKYAHAAATARSPRMGMMGIGAMNGKSGGTTSGPTSPAHAHHRASPSPSTDVVAGKAVATSPGENGSGGGGGGLTARLKRAMTGGGAKTTPSRFKALD